MINEHFGVLPSGISTYSVDYALKSAKVSGLTQKYESAKLLSTWQLMDILPRFTLWMP